MFLIVFILVSPPIAGRHRLVFLNFILFTIYFIHTYIDTYLLGPFILKRADPLFITMRWSQRELLAAIHADQAKYFMLKLTHHMHAHIYLHMHACIFPAPVCQFLPNFASVYLRTIFNMSSPVLSQRGFRSPAAAETPG